LRDVHQKRGIGVSQYRRYYVPGGSYFFTIVTHRRRPLFDDSSRVVRLRSALRSVISQWPFTVAAGVILPDHLHFIWTLPRGDQGYSRRIGRMKALFTESLGEPMTPEGTTLSRIKHRDGSVWQRRFWEHALRDEDDFKRHLDYIHYNPVKHELVSCPHLWLHSSFHHWAARGEYDAAWGCQCGGRTAQRFDFGDISDAAGE
jgi:putative transposase